MASTRTQGQPHHTTRCKSDHRAPETINKTLIISLRNRSPTLPAGILHIIAKMSFFNPDQGVMAGPRKIELA